MPPTSRGQFSTSLLQLLQRGATRWRHASTNRTNPADLTKLLGKLPRHIPELEKESARRAFAKAKASAEKATIPSTPPRPLSRLRAFIPFRAPPGSPRLGRRIGRFLFDGNPYVRIFFTIILPAIPVALLVYTHFPSQTVTVRGLSMAPFLNGGHLPDEPNTDDKVLVNLQFPVQKLKRGMVVVFRSPCDPEKVAVKRVVAVAGDRVFMRVGYPGLEEEKEEVREERVVEKGDEKHALKRSNSSSSSHTTRHQNNDSNDNGIIIPYGHIWVEGDTQDRDKSLDSNWYGPISLNLLTGVVTHIIWPWHRRATVRWQDWSPNTTTSPNPNNPPPHHTGVLISPSAVQLVHPDQESESDNFRNKTAEAVLKIIRQPGKKDELMLSSEGKVGMRDLYQRATRELERGDPETVRVAREIVDELDSWVKSGGEEKMKKKKKKAGPMVDKSVLKREEGTEEEAEG